MFRVKLNSIKLLKFQSKKPLNFFLVPMTYSSTISPKFNYLIFKLIITAYRLILPLHRHFFTKIALILRHENQAKNIVVDFYDNEYHLYLKNDNSEKDRSRTLSGIDFEKHNDSKEWYVSKKTSERIYAFPYDTDRLISKIKKLIVQLKSING